MTILLFGCLQQEQEKENGNENNNILNEEVEPEPKPEIKEEIEEDFDLIEVEKCVYTEENTIYYILENKLKMITDMEGYSFAFIIDGDENVMYDEEGIMLMGLVSDCDWVKYDFNTIYTEMKKQGVLPDDDDEYYNSIMEEMLSDIDESIICTNTTISAKEFEIKGKVCDETEMFLNIYVASN